MKFITRDIRAKLLYLTIILFVQVIISFLVIYFYPAEKVTTQSILFYNPTIFLSLSFIVISIFISYKANSRFKLILSGSILAFTELFFFIILVLISYYEGDFSSKIYIAKFLNYTFFHLGGFRNLLTYLFGIELLGNLFYALNATLILHMLGFILGDLIYFIRNRYYGNIKENLQTNTN